MAFVRTSYGRGDRVAAYSGRTSGAHERDIGLPVCVRNLVETYLPKDGVILDGACAAGEITYAMAAAGYRSVVGIDLSPEMISAARQIAHGGDLRPTFQVADITDLPFPDLHFDGALALHGITPLPTNALREAALRELHRVLKPAGHLIISTFLQEDPAFTSFWEEESRRWRDGTQDPRLHSLGDRIDEKAGFFLHIPREKDFRTMLLACGYDVVDAGWWHKFGDGGDAAARKCYYWITEKAS